MEITEYFRWLTELEPTDMQKELLTEAVNPDNMKILVCAGRQSGKTLTTAVIIMWYIFEYGEPINALLISAQDNILYFHMRELFKKHPELVEQLTERSRLAAELVPIRGFETIKGSVVFVKGSTTKQIMGTPADIVVIDEACEVKNNVIIDAIGCLSGKLSKLILVSTPHVPTSYFVEWATEEKPTFKIYTWSSEHLPWHKEEMVKEKKKRMSRQEYATQVLGRPPTREERAFFPTKQVEACIVDVEPIREGGENSRIEIGIDFGSTSPTILIITERIGTTRRKVLFMKQWKGHPIEEIGPEILDIISKWKPYITKGDSQPESYIRWFNNHGRKVKSIDLRVGHKEQMMGQLQKMVREKRIIIPINFVDIPIALKKYKYVNAKDAKSVGSDIVEALAFSIYEPIGGLGDTPRMVTFPNRTEDIIYQ